MTCDQIHSSPPWPERYYSYNRALRTRFGQRIQKVTVNAGYGCPNRNTDGGGGCIYCDNAAFNPNHTQPELGIVDQIEAGKKHLSRRYKASKYIAYFQAYSNTYAPVDTLAHDYRAALSVNDIVGLSIGTRPDCISDEVLDLLQQLAKNAYIQLEYGLQSSKDSTLALINRGHTAAAFHDTMSRSTGRSIDLCGHMIVGLPGEDGSDAEKTVRTMVDCGITGIKLHNLHLIKGTELAEHWRRSKAIGDVPIKLMNAEEYARIVADLIEIIPPHITIQQLVGSAPTPLLESIHWHQTHAEVVQLIQRELEIRDSWQGKRI